MDFAFTFIFVFLAELRVKDLDLTTRVLTVSRKVIEVNPQFHPDRRRPGRT